MVHSFNHLIMKFHYNDGGRSNYTNIVSKYDCVVRAIAITTGAPYVRVYRDLREMFPSLDGQGVNIRDARFTAYMESLGFILVEGITNMQAIPDGCVIACTTGHYSAIINGTIQDTHSEAHKIVSHYWVRGRIFDIVRFGKNINTNPLNGQQAITMRSLFTLNYGAGVHIKAV